MKTQTTAQLDQEIAALRQAAKARELAKILAGIKGNPLTEAELKAALSAAYDAGQEEMRGYAAAVIMTDTYNASLRG